MKIAASLLFFALLVILPLQFVAADQWVNGYTKSNGTYVNGYYRSNPDGNPYNNWSFPGNTNPYTGVTAGGSVGSYLKNYSSPSYTIPTYTFPYVPAYTSSHVPTYTPSYSSSLGSAYEDISHGYTTYGIVFCDFGYYEKNNKCVKEPTNGYAIGSTIFCDYGYELKGSDKCVLKSASSYGSFGSYSSSSSCPAHSSESLTDSTKCSCDVGYEVNKSKTKCVKITAKTNDKICRAEFGSGSEWNGEYVTDSTPYCVCKKKYEWNDGGTSCVKS